ncbi:unnamed protein product, partial [Pocillopora meandrina]
TETWLNNRVCSDCLQIAGYNPIIRLDRHNRMGGGVAFFTNSFGLNSASHLDVPCGVVTGRPTMTIVFSLLISSNIFSCFLIKFVNHRNNIGLLYWEISMLITTLQIHQGIMM